ncbi:hypothetical protein CEY16_03265 [Halalkalibacillus sediminis]|uniref:Dynamin N-terminal domain-containing protein n=1 Tax=Halalkalibacillus sediminis TaxID=2018042 RepID=A0A2I0QWR3_9BACI|nr:dynamin family protein [Halalkalibacillus sediminis]PKR78787.1 hypothetical protein CEY16_03265 [Halalkalibacillus sediminis]
MATTVKKETINFNNLYKELNKQSDESTLHKIAQIYQKWSDDKMTIGFTGHFSAGKSSMINYLLGEQLLPSSPIPTSANIVEISSGDELVRYQLNDGNYIEQDHLHVDQIHALSKNGQDVRTVTIQKPLKRLDENVSFMDTPGIDSSDDEEYDRTLASIHLIDYFVYIMDYNHVQSEINFEFLSRLEDNQVPYTIVVNQVDKHNESELPFEVYKQALYDSCDEWGLKPDSIYFTTLKSDDHPRNEVNDLISKLDSVMANKRAIIDKRTQHEVKKCISEYVDTRFEVEEYSFEVSLDTLKTEEQEILSAIEELEEFKKSAAKKMHSEVSNLLQNAYLMTFDTRELAEKWLESNHHKFKVGSLFTSKKKTEEEKELRESQFLNKINERIQSEMVWHIREFFMGYIKEYVIKDSVIVQEIQDFKFSLNGADLKTVLNPSAEINSDYVLRFTQDLQQYCVREIKNDLSPVIKKIGDQLGLQLESQIEERKTVLNEIRSKIGKAETIDQNTRQKEEFLDRLNDLTFDTKATEEKEINTYIERINSEYKQVDLNYILENSKQPKDEFTKQSQGEREELSGNRDPDALVQQARYLKDQMKSTEQLSHFYETIDQKINQYEQMEFTVALFGAFSAGKSSFANAWIGEELLPVSPNPTTAAINKICPPNIDHSHKEVIVSFKSEEVMQQQLEKILEPVKDQPSDSLVGMYRFLQKKWHKLEDKLSKSEASYVNAFFQGYSRSKERLGEEIQVNIQNYSTYVTDETVSCFVEEIELYYDCELTRQGVTLVDTPGADSVHARHTNVSMHYVKHSDLIIYVNYYNHAFARADREFLLRLGRVQNSFSMDKMFFILNAADLAESDEELKQVQTYLEQQLNQYQITNPAVYPVSSKQLLSGEKKSNQVPFFNRFDDFIQNDAKMLLTSRIRFEMDKLKSFLKKILEESTQDKERQAEILNEMKNDQARFKEWYESVDLTVYFNEIHQQTKELNHYVHERTLIQLTDYMKESINPATIESNGKKGRTEVRQAIKQMIIKLEQNLSNEFQSTNILLDATFNRAKKSFVEDANSYVEQNTSFSAFYFEAEEVDSIEPPKIFSNLNEEKLTQVASVFKDKKSFFENQEIKDLFEQLSQLIDSEVKDMTQLFEEIFIKAYEQKFEKSISEAYEEILEEQTRLIQSKKSFFENDELIAKYRNLLQEVSNKASID